MEAFTEFALSGIMVGGIYALIATGIVIIYKATKVFNFAVGNLMVLGAFVCWTMIEWGIPVWVSVLIAAIASYLVGMLIERLVMRPLIGQPLVGAMMATLALSILVYGLTMLIWSGYTRSFSTPIFPPGGISLGPLRTSGSLLGAFGVAMVVFAGLVIFFQRSATGLAMRATAESHLLAQSSGIRVTSIFAVTWAIAGVVGALVGICLADRLALGVTETANVAFKVFPVILLGGLDSIPGALVGGLVIGLAETLSGGYINPLFAQIVPYIILLLVLVVRPEGLWGLKRIERI